jgi:outer membrane immunogenic protein
MKKIALLAIPFAAAVSSPAMAQDTAGVGGFRLEAMIGYDIARAEFNEGQGRRDKGGVVGGAGVGYDVPLGTAFAVGADAELTFATTDARVTGIGEVQARRDIYVGGRITANISDAAAIYGKVGYTNLRARLRLNEGVTADDDDVNVGGNLDGVRGAVGVQFGGDEDRSFYGLEYRYSNYEADLIRHQGMLVVGYRF